MHRISDINEASRTGTCSICGPVKLFNKGKKTSGGVKWRCPTSNPASRWTPAIADRLSDYDKQRRKNLKYKKGTCSVCGFVPQHSCQLDIHHLDHNHQNNDPANLATVCANCHRLIHHRQLKGEEEQSVLRSSSPPV